MKYEKPEVRKKSLDKLLRLKTDVYPQKIEELSCLVHKLFVILTALQYKPQWKMG